MRLLFTLALALLAFAASMDAWRAWVARTDLPPVLAEVSAEVRAEDGTLLRAFPVEDGRWRLSVDVARVDPEFVDMLVAYEDKRFWTHSGVDGYALLRAAWQALWAGEVVSGGSTLSMQAARLLENSGTGSWRGKLRQMRVAWALEAQLSKQEILGLYLQHAPYGGPVEGIRSGARAWFGKSPMRLSAAEAALMIALPQSPEVRRPDRQPAAAQAARDRVLARLGLPATAVRVPRQMQALPRHAAHLAARLHSDHPAAARIDTLLDGALQKSLERLAQASVRGLPDGVNIAMIVAEHQTGRVVASIGAAEFGSARAGFIDMTRAPRSPGSTLKPLIYGLAFDAGLAHPETMMRDVPTAFGAYAPQNFDGTFRGDVTARQALRASLNIPPVALTEALGPARLMSALRASGAAPRVRGAPGLAVALGGVGLTLEELVQLYAGLARGGEAVALSAVPAARAPGAKLLSGRSAWHVADILKGSAAAAPHVAVKTGTSYGHRDAWAIGWDGQHVVGIWMGRPDGTAVPGVFGADLAVPVLLEAFGRVGPKRVHLPPPPADTLLLPTALLPAPLQRFGTTEDGDRGPRVVFPPDGARLAASDVLVVKVKGGALPLSVLVNGAPAATGVRDRAVSLPWPGTGYLRVSVLDATGKSAAIEVELSR